MEYVATKNAPGAIGPYSQAVKVGGLLFTSGQIAINPKTNTSSIDDSNTGDSLNKTLDRMWQSINNKLSRVVNSVNGRTGVVVLSPEDVGLDQVDNVSLSDIKKWVINRLSQEFNNKRIALFNPI